MTPEEAIVALTIENLELKRELNLANKTRLEILEESGELRRCLTEIGEACDYKGYHMNLVAVVRRKFEGAS